MSSSVTFQSRYSRRPYVFASRDRHRLPRRSTCTRVILNGGGGGRLTVTYTHTHTHISEPYINQYLYFSLSYTFYYYFFFFCVIDGVFLYFQMRFHSGPFGYYIIIYCISSNPRMTCLRDRQHTYYTKTIIARVDCNNIQ